MTHVRLENVYKQYPNGFVAVRDFNLDIADNEFIVFVGPSGCGKTTVLRMIAGLEEISGGSIYIDDKRVNDVEPKDRDCAMVFQNYALYPHMTVYENMSLGLKIRKFKSQEIKSRVEKAANILGLKDYLDKKPKTLSGGQRQRVALGRAIVREPNLFLLDEPLSNLDAKLRARMRVEITKLYLGLGATFIYVTHDQVEAMTMGTKIVVINEGVIQQVDTPQNIFNKPFNTFVAAFIGSPEMNFLKANLISIEDGMFLEFNSHRIPISQELHKSDCLDPYINHELIVGIRAENISVIESRIEDENSYQTKVDVAELLGSETLVYFTLNDSNFTAKIPDAIALMPEQKIAVKFDSQKLHLFDPHTKENILRKVF